MITSSVHTSVKQARALVLKNNGAQENGGTESEVPAEAEAETTPVYSLLLFIFCSHVECDRIPICCP